MWEMAVGEFHKMYVHLIEQALGLNFSNILINSIRIIFGKLEYSKMWIKIILSNIKQLILIIQSILVLLMILI